MTIKETKEILGKLKLPGNCECDDSTCNVTWAVRFKHEERDALQKAINFYIHAHP